MNTKILIGIIIITIIGGGIFVVSQSNHSSPTVSKNTTKQEEAPGSINAPAQTASGQRYVVYSKSALNQAVNKRRVLFFYANWCPICRPIDVEFKQNESKIPQDVVVIRVNYNDSETSQEAKNLAQKYGVAYQHTFVQIDSQGNKIALWNGGGLAELLTNIK